MPDQGLWCVATKVGHLYALALCRDTTQRPRPMRERFADIVSLVQHADQVKEDFLAMGWREPEPDLHPHGSWAYGRLTLVPSSWGTGAGAAGQPDDTASLDD
jgi:hypothetical protein